MVEGSLSHAQLGVALSDPTDAAPLVDAVLWIQHIMLGTIATLIAVLAIATIGALALFGRIDLRRSVTTIIGCFILFGAPSIAAGFIKMATFGIASPPISVPPPIPAIPPSPSTPNAFDPYGSSALAGH